MVKERCWNPYWNPLLEPIVRCNPVLEPCWNPLSALEPVLDPLLEPCFLPWNPYQNPPLCALGHFREFNVACGPSEPRLALNLGHL